MASSFRGSSARLRIRLGDLELLADVPGHDAVRLAPGTPVTVDLVHRPVLVAPSTRPTAVTTPGTSSPTAPMRRAPHRRRPPPPRLRRPGIGRTRLPARLPDGAGTAGATTEASGAAVRRDAR
nr:hypothetical protein GCM10020093_049090 [Planobispora longispora]